MNLKKSFTTTSIVLIPITVGINVVGGLVASSLKLPIWIDSIGTMVAGAMAGPWVAAVTGLLTNVFLGLVQNPVFFAYSVVNVAIGLVVGYMAVKGWFSSWPKVIVVGLIVVVVQVLTASPVSVLMFGGVSGATGVSALTGYLIATTQKVVSSVVRAQFIFALIDKLLSIVVAYVVIKSIPKRYLSDAVRESLR